MAYNEFTEFLKGFFYDGAVTTAVTVSATPLKVGRIIIACAGTNAIVTFRQVDDTPIFFSVQVLANTTVVIPLGVEFSDLEVVSDQTVAVAVFSFSAADSI